MCNQSGSRSTMSSPTRTTASIGHVREHIAEIIEQARRTRAPVVITDEDGAAAVVLDIEEHERRERALEMLMLVARGIEAADAGDRRPVDRAFSRLQERARERRASISPSL